MPIIKYHPELEAPFKALGDPETLHDLFRIHPEGRALVVPDQGDPQQMLVHANHPHWTSLTHLDLDTHRLHNRSIISEGAPPGTGTKVLARQVLAARKLGIHTIHIHHAAGEGPSDFFKGSYVWPRLGFNVDLPQHLWKQFPGHKDFHSLMKDPKGREKWRQLSTDLYDLTFDTRPDSPHSQHLLEYMKSKDIKV